MVEAFSHVHSLTAIFYALRGAQTAKGAVTGKMTGPAEETFYIDKLQKNDFFAAAARAAASGPQPSLKLLNFA